MNKIKNKFEIIAYNNIKLCVFTKSELYICQPYTLLRVKPQMFILIVAGVYE
jgi:hypothetical protein